MVAGKLILGLSSSASRFGFDIGCCLGSIPARLGERWDRKTHPARRGGPCVKARSCGIPLFSAFLSRAGASEFVKSRPRSEEHTSELQSLMRISYAVFCLKKTTI